MPDRFAERLNSACENNPNVPPKFHGQRSWMQEQLEKRYGIRVSAETLSKWFNGDTKPREKKMQAIAELLGVDVAWLSLGVDPLLTPRERSARNRAVEGAINLIAGFAQMDGAAVAFPTDRDSEAVDLYAIIKGVNYAIHVAVADSSSNGELHFVLPTKIEHGVVLGVERRKAFSVNIAEIPPEMIERAHVRGGSRELKVPRDWFEGRLLEGFSERL